MRGDDLRDSVPLGPPDGHAVLIHHGAVDRARAAARWAVRGVATNQQVLFEAVDRTDADAFLMALDSLDADIGSDQVQVLEAGTVTAAPLLLDRVEHALELGYLGLRLAGANGHLLAELTDEDYTRHEAAVDELSHSLPVVPLCAFDTSVLFPGTVERAIREHTRINGPDFRLEVGAASLTCAGALDGAAEPAVALSLARVLEPIRGSVARLSINLGQVTLLAAACARSLVEGTRSFRESGGIVEVLAGPAARLVLGLQQVGHEEGLLVLQDGAPW